MMRALDSKSLDQMNDSSESCLSALNHFLGSLHVFIIMYPSSEYGVTAERSTLGPEVTGQRNLARASFPSLGRNLSALLSGYAGYAHLAAISSHFAPRLV